MMVSRAIQRKLFPKSSDSCFRVLGLQITVQRIQRKEHKGPNIRGTMKAAMMEMIPEESAFQFKSLDGI